MKKLIFLVSLFALPMAAIADNLPVSVRNQLPANYMIFRGKVYNLNSMAGNGVNPIPVAQPTATTSTYTPKYIPSDAIVAAERAARDASQAAERAARDASQREAYEGAIRAIRLEYLQNAK